MNKLNHELPKELQDSFLSGGFYVKMDKNYTATVRNLRDFISYINNSEIDLEVFGEITNTPSDEPNLELFSKHLNIIIGKVRGFKTFNEGYSDKHTFIALDNTKETISLKTKSGKRITIAVMDNAKCVDVMLHDSEEEENDNGNKQFKVIGFNGGATPIPHTNVSLMTILL